MKLEKQANTQLHEALQMSYGLAQMKEKDGWSFNNPDEMIEHLVKKFKRKEKNNDIFVDYLSEFATKGEQPKFD